MATENSTETQQDRENRRIDEINIVLADLHMMGDLLIASSNSPDPLDDDTPMQAGWFVTRQADKLKTLLGQE